jgi:glutathione synthase/RimK-type ligase-like ATP-grasp enzyme
MRQVALVTAAHLPAGTEDTAGLMSRFQDVGAHPVLVQWSDDRVRWQDFDRVLLHSPWDYSNHLPEFVGWLDRFRDDHRLVNSQRLIVWNLDKRYLMDLRQRGIALPATMAEPTGRSFTEAAIEELSAGRPLVVKPAVGAGGTRTFRTSSAAEALTLIRDRMPDEPVLIQQYESAVEVSGEYSAVYLGNAVSHVVRKRPRAAEFRVQAEHGGTTAPQPVEPWIENYTHSVIGQLPSKPSYARVDFIVDEAGSAKLMEIELAEPDLFLRYDEDSYARLVEAVMSDG